MSFESDPGDEQREMTYAEMQARVAVLRREMDDIMEARSRREFLLGGPIFPSFEWRLFSGAEA